MKLGECRLVLGYLELRELREQWFDLLTDKLDLVIIRIKKAVVVVHGRRHRVNSVRSVEAGHAGVAEICQYSSLTM